LRKTFGEPAAVDRAIGREQQNRALLAQPPNQPGSSGLLGESRAMQAVYKVIEKASQHSYAVLILGESGTGKELVARAIHSSGPRRNRPFVPVDCTSLVATLVESELFGYVEGAFTGAVRAKRGLVETANQGTLFLDEIGDLPPDLQAKLLRVLQEREVRPVGGTKPIPITPRVIAATNRDLETAVSSGKFRQDLYFRLNVVEVRLPPLRERKDDVPLLIVHLLDKFCEGRGEVRTFSREALRLLTNYDWPGNVRELENAVARALALSSNAVLGVEDLPPCVQYMASQPRRESPEHVPLDELKRHAIFRALRDTGGDRLAAARLLGIGKTTIYRKLKDYARAPARGPDQRTQEKSPRARYFLICVNPRCRFLTDLRPGGAGPSRAEAGLNGCPECGHEWSCHCPFCGQQLKVIWRNESPYCSHCIRALQV